MNVAVIFLKRNTKTFQRYHRTGYLSAIAQSLLGWSSFSWRHVVSLILAGHRWLFVCFAPNARVISGNSYPKFTCNILFQNSLTFFLFLFGAWKQNFFLLHKNSVQFSSRQTKYCVTVMLLQCCCSVAVMLLQCCCSVTVTLLQCYCNVTWCYCSVVAMLL